jgi:type IV pilus assembly protein PilO
LKKLTVSLSVESPSYEDLEKFIDTLESLNRIVVVESISYSGGQEITSLDQEDEPLSYSLTISAFYMPSLTDLAAELPKIDAPAPAGKDNPLSQFSATIGTQP